MSIASRANTCSNSERLQFQEAKESGSVKASEVKRERKKYTVEWTRESCRTARWILAYGFIFTAFPVYWDQSLMEMGITTNKWLLRRYKCMVIIISACGVALPISLIRKIMIHGIDVHSFREMLAVYSTIIPLLFIPFYLHTAFRIDQVRTFINAAHSFYEDFQEKYSINRKSAGKEDAICGLIKFIVLVAAIGACCIAVVLYLTSCEFHSFSNVFPICNEDGSHKSNTLIWIWANIIYVGASTLTFAGILYVDISLGSILFGMYIMKELSVGKTKSRTLETLQDDGNSWNIVYRSLQLVFKLLNECVGEYLLPILLTFFCTAAVLMGYALIKYDLKPVYQLGASGVLVFVLFCNALFNGQSAHVMRLSEEALTSRRQLNRSLAAQKFLRSCPLFRVSVGPFFPLKKSTETSVLQNILDYTVDAILIYKIKFGPGRMSFK